MNSNVFFLIYGQTLLFLWMLVTLGYYFALVAFSKSRTVVKVAYYVLVPLWFVGSMYLTHKILVAISASFESFGPVAPIHMVGLLFSYLLFGWLGQGFLFALSFKAIAPRAWDRFRRHDQDEQ